ncbi:uncharacterized protein LOC131800334 isoform X1 [Musca domestica]|uniref:Uncharacterized protein LOC101890794 isoform X3 n=1 Tax=Musca domestica TaxID=7370 RepID=A0A905J523_MUSDO|nr:uncharacterized protein LOC131800334 isoform X1 [Musca domestica]
MEFGYGVLIWILSLALLLNNNINCNEFGVGDHVRNMHLVLTVMLNHSMSESNHTAIPTANSNTTNISPQKDVTSTSQGNENTDCLTTTTACPTTTTTCPTTTTCEPIPEHMATDPIPENLNKPAKTLLTLNDCASLPDNTVLTDSRHCRRFYVCQRGRVKRQRCSLTQWYDREALTCRDRKLVTNCPANKS